MKRHSFSSSKLRGRRGAGASARCSQAPAPGPPPPPCGPRGCQGTRRPGAPLTAPRPGQTGGPRGSDPHTTHQGAVRLGRSSLPHCHPPPPAPRSAPHARHHPAPSASHHGFPESTVRRAKRRCSQARHENFPLKGIHTTQVHQRSVADDYILTRPTTEGTFLLYTLWLLCFISYHRVLILI